MEINVAAARRDFNEVVKIREEGREEALDVCGCVSELEH